MIEPQHITSGFGEIAALAPQKKTWKPQLPQYAGTLGISWTK